MANFSPAQIRLITLWWEASQKGIEFEPVCFGHVDSEALMARMREIVEKNPQLFPQAHVE